MKEGTANTSEGSLKQSSFIKLSLKVRQFFSTLNSISNVSSIVVWLR